MTILTNKLRVGLPILAAVAFVTWAAVAHGIVGGFASLGALLLIGMAGLVIYVLATMLRRSNMSFKGRYSRRSNTSPISPDGIDSKHVM